MKPLNTLVVICLSGVIACNSQEESSGCDCGQVETKVDLPANIYNDSLARLPTVERGDLDADGQRSFDIIVNPESRYADGLRGPLGMWMYSPKMVEHMFPASTYLRFGTEKNQRLTELCIITTAREINSQYEYSAHEAAARRAGLEEDIIDLVKYGRSLDQAGEVSGMGPVERTIIQFTRELINEPKISAETFVQARKLFGEEGVMNLTGLIGYYNFVNFTIKTFDVHLAPGRERLLPVSE